MGPYSDERYELWSVVCKLVESEDLLFGQIMDLLDRVERIEKKVDAIDRCVAEKLREIGEGYDRVREMLEQIALLTSKA